MPSENKRMSSKKDSKKDSKKNSAPAKPVSSSGSPVVGAVISVILVCTTLCGVYVAITQYGVNITHVSPILKEFGIVPPAKPAVDSVRVPPPNPPTDYIVEPAEDDDVIKDAPAEETIPVEEPTPVKEPSSIEDVVAEDEGPLSSVEDNPVEEATTPIEKSIPVEEADPVAESDPVEEAEPIEEVTPVETSIPVEEAEPVVESTPIEEAEPIEEATPVEKSIPVEEAEPVAESAPVEEAEPIEEATPVETSIPVEEAEPAVESGPIEEAEPIEEATPVEKSIPVQEAEPVVESAPVEEAEPIEEATPVEKSIPVPEADPVVESASVEEAEPIEEATPVEKSIPVQEAEPVVESAPVEEVIPFEEAMPDKVTVEVEETIPIEVAVPVEESSPVQEVTPMEGASPNKETASNEEDLPVEEATPVKEVDPNIPEYANSWEIENWSKIQAAQALMDSGDLTGSRDAFDELKKASRPRSYIAMYGMAKAIDLLCDQNPDEMRNSIQSYRSLTGAGSEVPKEIMKPALLRVIIRLRESGRARMAISTLEKHLPKFPGDLELSLGLAELHIGNEKSEDAIKVLKTLPKDNVNVQVQLALAHKTNKNYEGAIDQLSAIKTEALTVELVNILGDCLRRSDQNEKAVTVFKAAVENNIIPSIYQRPSNTLTPALTAKPVWSVSEVKLKDVLLSEKSDEEAMVIVNKGLFGEMEGDLQKNGVWGYFDIATNDVWSTEGCATVPTICKALKNAGLGLVGKTYISLFYPMSSSWPHTATTNNLLTVILPLMGDTDLRIADIDMTLNKGDTIIIDPSFEQELSNNLQEVSMYIISQIIHPDL